MNERLLTEKSFDSCNKGYQIIFNPDGKLNSEGYFLENKRIGLWKYYIKDSMYAYQILVIIYLKPFILTPSIS